MNMCFLGAFFWCIYLLTKKNCLCPDSTSMVAVWMHTIFLYWDYAEVQGHQAGTIIDFFQCCRFVHLWISHHKSYDPSHDL